MRNSHWFLAVCIPALTSSWACVAILGDYDNSSDNATPSGGAGGTSAPSSVTSSGASTTGTGSASGPGSTSSSSSTSGTGGMPGSSSVGSGGGGAAGTGGMGPGSSTVSTAASSGVGGGGNPPNIFVGGPCVATPDLTSAEVFAQGQDQHIYRKVNDGTAWGSWVKIAGLDGNVISDLSDLDCSANPTTVNIVATGVSPLGAYMHAIGFGTTYNPFIRELPSTTFDPNPSITAIYTQSGVRAAGVNMGFPTVEDIGNAMMTYTPIPNFSVFSDTPGGVDLSWQPSTTSDSTFLAAFDRFSGDLAVYELVFSESAPTGAWNPAVLVPPPPGGMFQFSPTICTEDPAVMGGYSRHVVAVVGNQLWHAVADGSPLTFSAWESMGATVVTSSPDCTVMNDGSIHTVALGSKGSVLDVSGTTGSWKTTDLKAY